MTETSHSRIQYTYDGAFNVYYVTIEYADSSQETDGPFATYSDAQSHAMTQSNVIEYDVFRST